MQRSSRASTSKGGTANFHSSDDKLSTKSGLPRLSTVGSTHPRLSSAGKSARPSYERGRKQSVSSLRITPNKNCLTPLNVGSKLQVPQLANRCSVDTVRSSFGGRGRKEGWPVSDPSFKTLCIDKVLCFLNDNPPPFPYGRATLRNPTAKDFSSIFTHIYSYIDPSYKLPQRFEDGLPTLLKAIKYPVQMPKSSFQNVGSPHSWPSVLAMLQWLVESICVPSFIDQNMINPSDDFGESNNDSMKINGLIKVFVSLYSESSNAGEFVEDEEIEKLHNEYSHYLKSGEELFDEDFELLQEQEQILLREIEAVPYKLEHLNEIQDKHNQLKLDKDKMDEYNHNLLSYVNQKNAEKEESCNELRKIDEDINCEESACNELQLHIEKEGMSDSEIKLFKNKAGELQLRLNQRHQELKELEEKKWSLEMNIGKYRHVLWSQVAKYNSSCSALEINCEISSNDLMFDLGWEDTIAPELMKFRKKMRDENYEIENQRAVKDDEIEKAEEHMNGKKSEFLKLESKRNRLKEEVQNIKDQMQIDEMEFHRELEKENCGLSSIRNPQMQANLREHQNLLKESEKEMATVQQKKEELIKKGDEKKKEAMNNVKKMVVTLKNHREENEIFKQQTSAKHLERCKKILLNKGKACA